MLIYNYNPVGAFMTDDVRRERKKEKQATSRAGVLLVCQGERVTILRVRNVLNVPNFLLENSTSRKILGL